PVTSYSYDSAGNLASVTYPDASSESFTYDDDGNLLTDTDRRGNTTSYSYNVSVRRRHVGSGPARRSSQPRAHEQANDMLGMGMAGCACAEGRTCGRLPPPRRAGQTGHAGDRWADMNVRPARSRTRRG